MSEVSTPGMHPHDPEEGGDPRDQGQDFPVSLKLRGRACLVVGSNQEAVLRTRALLHAGAHVLLLTRLDASTVQDLTHGAQAARVEQREAVAADLVGRWLVVLTDPDSAQAARLSALAEAHHIFFCAVDQPAFNSFAHMAVTRADALTVAVSTRGRVPALARRLKAEFDQALRTDGFVRLVRGLARLRAETPVSERKRVLGTALDRAKLRVTVSYDE